ncbi:stalk domain-containing protein [Cytobacillus mangrovibacter]|uniref:stalk domain-containing protein n=1 Tax=Cytobacillus mangrovibacter TaxID=3299024 RepID=UPI0036F37181
MWRTASLIFVIFLTAIGGVLSWQWKAYSKQASLGDDNIEKVVQELTVQSSEKDLHITQRISGLKPDKEYQVVIPGELFQWLCIKDNGDPCESKDENPQTFLPDKDTLIFQYTIPIQKIDTAFLLKEWTTDLLGVIVKATDIEIIDIVRRKGSWVAGMPLKGIKEMDLIDYYLFKGNGAAPALYWQPAALQNKQTNKEVSYYINQQGLVKDYDFEELNRLKGYPFVSVVFTDQLNENSGKGMIVTSSNTKEEMLKRKLVHYYYQMKFNELSADEKWLLDVFTSYTAKLTPLSEKGKAILQELKENLSEDELAALFNEINNGSGEMNTEKLDKFIYKIKGLPTRFFTLNKTESTKWVPFHYYDPRKISIGNKEQIEGEAIYDKGMMLYPFMEIMEKLEFEVKVLPNHKSILVLKGRNSYRFYLNQNIFIYNEEDYGLLENPLVNLNGHYYMSKQWLQTIFKISIDEGKEDIKLSL